MLYIIDITLIRRHVESIAFASWNGQGIKRLKVIRILTITEQQQQSALQHARLVSRT